MQAEQHSEFAKILSDLFDGFTVETTPNGAKTIPDFREYLRPETGVFITHLPGADIADTVATAVRLRKEGFNPIPHLAARSIPTKAILAEVLERLTVRAKIKEVLLIAGGLDKPLGEFFNTMQMLDTGLFERFNISRIGIAGHPEGSPDISDEAIRAALHWKNEFAIRTGLSLYIITQLCFESKPIIDWEQRLISDGNRLPIYIGIPGIATIKNLLHYAKTCGAGPSTRFLTRQIRSMTKLLTLSAPDTLVLELARHCQRSKDSLIRGVHVYPLGGLKKSAQWSYGITDGSIDANSTETSFNVHNKVDGLYNRSGSTNISGDW